MGSVRTGHSIGRDAIPLLAIDGAQLSEHDMGHTVPTALSTARRSVRGHTSVEALACMC